MYVCMCVHLCVFIYHSPPFFNAYLFNAYVPECMCFMCVCSTSGGQKGAPNLLQLELKMVISCREGAGD